MTRLQCFLFRKLQDVKDDGNEERERTSSLSPFSASFPSFPASASFSQEIIGDVSGIQKFHRRTIGTNIQHKENS